MATKKRKPGRPKTANPRTERFIVRMTPGEVRELQKRAAMAGKPLSDHARAKLLGGA